jgi:hypothetical protein
MCTTHADVINPDLLAFIRGDQPVPEEQLVAIPVVA